MKSKAIFLSSTYSFILLVLFLYPLGCAKKSSRETETNVTGSLKLSTSPLTVYIGSSEEVTVTSYTNSGVAMRAFPKSTVLTFWGCPEDIATIEVNDSIATVTGHNPGTCLANVTLSEFAKTTVKITVAARKVEAISITPSSAVGYVGESKNFSAVATLTDGTNEDVTSQVAWSSSPSSGVVFDNLVKGKLLIAAEGVINISATLPGLSATAQLTSTLNESLKKIVVLGGLYPNMIGVSQKFRAIGLYQNGTTQDLTNSVNWTSSATGVASINNSSNKGLAQLLTTGSATISATLDSVSAQKSITIASASLTDLTIAPTSIPLASGFVAQYSATGLYSDGTVVDLTQFVTWTSSDVSKATVSDTRPTKGLVSGISSGVSTISATVAGVTETAAVVVTSSTLTGLNVYPSSQTIPVGAKKQFSAEGSFSDLSVLDTTSLVSWTSSSADAMVSNTSNSKGLVTGISDGSANVTASKDSRQASSTVTVSQASLQSISVSPSSFSLTPNSQKRLKAIATYSDSSTMDVTDQVTWESSAENIAVVANAEGDQGTVLALSSGSFSATAVLEEIVGSSSGTVDLASAPAIDSILVTPSTAHLSGTATQSFSALAVNTNGSSSIITGSSAWSSSNPGVATIHPTTGLLTGVGPGTTIVSASKSGNTGFATAIVTVDQASPPPPSGVTGSALSTTSISFSWSSGGGTTASYKYAYQSGSSAPSDCDSGTTGITASTSVVLSGLSAGTMYSIIVCSVNADNPAEMSTPSSSASQFTKPETPTSFTAATASYSSIDLSWTDMAADTGGYKIAYKSGSTAPATCDSDSTSNIAANLTTANISGLSTGLTYTFIICTVNSTSGYSEPSAGVSAVTDSTPTTPTSFTATASTSSTSTINLGWDDMSGDAGGYKIAYQSGASAPANCNLGTTTTAAANATSKSITGLAAATQYSFIICTVNATSSLSAASSSVSATTIPATPTGLAGTATSTSQIDLSWADMSGDTGGYKIAYKSGAVAPADCNSDTTTTAAANATSKSITGLSIVTQYTFIICTVNSTSGQSVASSGVSVYTKPAAPTNLATSTVSTTAIDLSWDDMANDTGGYKIAYKVGVGAPADCNSDTTVTAAANATTQSITGLSSGSVYTFIICNVSSLAGMSVSSSSAAGTTDSSPSTPTSFTATASTSSTSTINLGWDDMSGDAGGYKIAYQSGASAPANCNLGTTTTAAANATSKSITGLAAATQYSFIICTVNATSSLSAASSSVSATTIPATPTGLAGTATSTSQIDLSWADMAGDTGGYKIAYKSGAVAPADCNSDTTTTAAANATSKSITGLSIVTQYTFIICTVNSTSGQSVASSGVSAYTKPAAPTNLATSTVSTTAIDLSWDDMANDTGGYKIAYKVGVGASADCNSDTTVTAAANATTQSITGLSSGSVYTFIICNVSSLAGMSVSSSSAAGTTDSSPSTPTSFTATASTSSTSTINLAWDDMSGDAGGYKIAYQSGASAPANCNLGTTTTATANATSKSITGLAAATQYSFIICTVNATSSLSAASSSVSATTIPATPTGLAGTATSTSQIDLSWADMAGDTGGYMIAYKSGAVAPADCNSDTTTTAAANATSKSITGLSIVTQYTFIICTVNSTSGQSVASSGVSAYTKPAAPTTFAASTVSTTQINLSWDDMTNDTGGYKIAYQTGSSAPADCSTGSTTTAAANATTKSITGLSAGTQYSFIICTVNSLAGDSLSSSSASKFTVPSAPSINAVVNSASQITISWSVILGDSGGYKIAYQSGAIAPADCNSGTTTTASMSATSKAITGLAGGTQYTFIACTVNSDSGQSAASSSATGTTTVNPPGAFTISGATNGDTQSVVTWGSSSGAASYTVKYGTSTGSYGTTFSTSATSPTSVTGLANGTTYYFMVVAVNAGGNTNATSEISATPASAGSSTTYNSGSGNFVVPGGVTSVIVEVWGGGGGGGSGKDAGGSGGSPGAGGGGYCKKTLSVSPAQTIAYVVGAGGAGSTTPELTDPGGNGGTSSATYSSTTYTATGGGGGASFGGTPAGSGGAGSGCDENRTGGTGSLKLIQIGGGGGSSAATGSNGTSATSSSTGATAPSGGGNGGNGGASNTAGSVGSAPGGGGGGGGRGVSGFGGNGANGRVVFTW